MITEEWLFERSIPEPNTGCWLWLGSYGVAGRARYGQIYVGRLFFNLTDPKIYALHHCDQPACVNPEHMYVGTHTQNMVDKVRRNRANRPMGNMYRAKLTPEQVLAIRKDPRLQRVIAAEYGVTVSAISDCQRGHRWGWLP